MPTTPRVRRSPIVVPPPAPCPHAAATLIFVHGYNFVGAQFAGHPPGPLNVAHHVHQSPALQHVKIVIAEALPSRHASIRKNVWYDIPSSTPSPGDPKLAQWFVEFGNKDNNTDDMEVSLDYLQSLVQSEIENGTAAARIVLMGDSQGAGMVVLFLLTRRLAAELGAVISYAGFNSTDLLSVRRMQREHGMEGKWSRDTILFMLHGKNDTFVPVEIAQAWRDQLQTFRERDQGIARIEWKLLDDVRHSLTSKVWPHIREILGRVVPAENQPLHKL